MYHASHFTADLTRSSSLGQIFYVLGGGGYGSPPKADREPVPGYSNPMIFNDRGKWGQFPTQ